MKYISRTLLKATVGKKKVIGFGAGKLGYNTVNYFGQHFDYFIDNDKQKIGENLFDDLKINSVDALNQEDTAKIIVVICSEKYAEMVKQLKALPADYEIFLSPLLKDFSEIDKLKNFDGKILVSAYGVGCGLYMVDVKDKQYTKVATGSFRGIATMKDRLFVASEFGQVYEITSVEPFELELRYTPALTTQPCGLIGWDEKEYLLMAETLNDEIAFIDTKTFTKVKSLKLNEKSVPGNDRYHINDMLIHDRRLYFTCLSKSGNWKQGIHDGALHCYDLYSDEAPVVMQENLVFPHSLIYANNAIHWLESLRGVLSDVNRNTIYQLPGFLRGIEYSEGMMFIGQSRNRRFDDSLHFGSPLNMDSGVYVINKAKGIFTFIELPEMSDVYSIKVL